ncbi:MAG: hypothetical protein EXR71_02600 [Myxococcales bacterium]|nr:hypothetical protein [Myxococcales bacterium]
MPAPAARPPPPPERALPDNLDELVRRAMSGGGVDALKQALSAPGAGAVRAAAAPVGSIPSEPLDPGPSADAAPDSIEPDGEAVAMVGTGAPTPQALAAASPVAPLDALVAAAGEARAAHDVATRKAALERVRAALEAAERPIDDDVDREAAAPTPDLDPEPPDEGPPFRIPLARLPYALVIGAVPSGVETGALASALDVDAATARVAVLAGGTRIVLRAAVATDLERRLPALSQLGVAAAVISREALLATEAARACVAAAAADSWRVIDAPRWGSERPEPARLPVGEVHVPGQPILFALGEVEEHQLRTEAKPSRWGRTRYSTGPTPSGEGRVVVIDVHTADVIYRFVEGAVDLRELPGADTNAQHQAMKLLQGALVARWPTVPIEPKRICVATARPGARVADGWPAWEEHTRVCRLLWLEAARTGVTR